MEQSSPQRVRSRLCVGQAASDRTHLNARARKHQGQRERIPDEHGLAYVKCVKCAKAREKLKFLFHCIKFNTLPPSNSSQRHRMRYAGSSAKAKIF